MSVNQVNFSIIPFSNVQWSGDIASLAQLLADHLQGTLDNSVFSGQDGGTEPQTDVGLWFNVNHFEDWDDTLGKYRPLGLVSGCSSSGTLYQVWVRATNTTADTIVDLPNKSGQLALIADIDSPVPTETQVVSGVANIHWQNRNLYLNITANFTVSDTGGGVDGQTINMWVETPPSTATPKTISFPGTWRTSVTALCSTDSTHRGVDHFEIKRIGIDTFVEQKGTFQIPTTQDTVAPTFVSAEIVQDTTILFVTFNELLRGVSVSPAGQWIVKKDTITQEVDAIFISSNLVALTLSASIPAGSVVTVQYISDSSVADLAGNLAASIAAQPVGVIS